MVQTLKQFISKNRIRASAEMVDRHRRLLSSLPEHGCPGIHGLLSLSEWVLRWLASNPNMNDMPAGSAHYKVVLRMGGKQMTVPFSMGPAHCKEPNAEDVLNCLASDSSSVENARGDFEEWASEYGYDTDSRKAEKLFRACKKQAESLKKFLGDELYESLLWETESL